MCDCERLGGWEHVVSLTRRGGYGTRLNRPRPEADRPKAGAAGSERLPDPSIGTSHAAPQNRLSHIEVEPQACCRVQQMAFRMCFIYHSGFDNATSCRPKRNRPLPPMVRSTTGGRWFPMVGVAAYPVIRRCQNCDDRPHSYTTGGPRRRLLAQRRPYERRRYCRALGTSAARR